MSDPLDDLRRREDELYEYEQRCPVCAICGEHITHTDWCYSFDDWEEGDVVCPECLEDYLATHMNTTLELIGDENINALRREIEV